MKMMIFAKRCAKEILRDPLTLCFGLGFPLMILLLLHTIQSNIPAALLPSTHLRRALPYSVYRL